jgi:hypothetical protein
MTYKELGDSWNRVRSILKKNGLLKEYVSVVELQERGAPHLHVIATGKYISQKQLAEWASSSGFGAVTDIRAVRGTGPKSITGYVLKQLSHELADYVTKSKTEQLKERATDEGKTKRKQVRPVRHSKYWYPGGFKAAEQVALAKIAALTGKEEGPKDAGPWWVVLKRLDGNVSVISRPKDEELDELTQAREARASAATSAEESDGEAITEQAA